MAFQTFGIGHIGNFCHPAVVFLMTLIAVLFGVMIFFRCRLYAAVIIRAIEIAKALGKVPQIKEIKPKYKFIKICLYLPKEILKAKIEKRMKKMFEQGLLKEIQKLKKLGVTSKRLEELGFEYNEPTYEKVVKANLDYAKRQMTWFKRDKEIKWFDASNPNNQYFEQ